VSSLEWDERAVIGRTTNWFWDPLQAQHVGRYLWAKSMIGQGDILDVACGTGYGSALLARSGNHVLGVDVSTEAVAQATHDFGSPLISFAVGDAARLPATTNSVDYVVSFETIEHLQEPAEFVAEVARVLRPGGTLLLSTPDRDIYSRGRTDGRSNNPYHPSEMTRAELLALLARHLEIREVFGQSAVDFSPLNIDKSSGPAGVVRARVKDAIRVATGPLVRNNTVAYWLFPRIRQRHVPVSSTLGEYTYIVVRAEKS
jgi:SAM-dependent methyltransferase